VVKPPQGLETARIFQAPELKRDSESATISGFAADPYGFGHNDLQPVAERLCPQVAQGLVLLSRRGLLGRMTGSGSAVFAPVAESAPGHAVDVQVPAGWQARWCSNLEAHPLGGWAPDED